MRPLPHQILQSFVLSAIFLQLPFYAFDNLLCRMRQKLFVGQLGLCRLYVLCQCFELLPKLRLIRTDRQWIKSLSIHLIQT